MRVRKYDLKNNINSMQILFEEECGNVSSSLKSSIFWGKKILIRKIIKKTYFKKLTSTN